MPLLAVSSFQRHLAALRARKWAMSSSAARIRRRVGTVVLADQGNMVENGIHSQITSLKCAMLDDRAKLLLKALVERYIADGQPVGSRTLSRASGLELSPATIRNVMSDLEELGLIASPHTSAGRMPTARGYRLFVDTMLTVQREDCCAPAGRPAAEGDRQRGAAAVQPVAVRRRGDGAAAHLGVPHIEFLRLSERRCWSSSSRPTATCRTASSSPRPTTPSRN
jgi:hypothetical protein